MWRRNFWASRRVWFGQLVLPDFTANLKTTSANTESTPGPLCRYQLLSCCCCYSVTKSSQTLCNPWTAALPCQASLSFTISQSLLKLTFIEVSDAIQPSHSLSPPSPPAFNLSQHQGLFQWVVSSHQVTEILQLQLQHQSFQWIFRGWFPFGFTGLISVLFKRLSGVFSSTTSLSCKQGYLFCSMFPYFLDCIKRTDAAEKWHHIKMEIYNIWTLDAEAETPILWSPDAKNWLDGKDPDAGKDWRQEKGTTDDEMVEWHHRLDGRVAASSGSWWWIGKPGNAAVHGVAKSQTQQQPNWTECACRRRLLITELAKN